MAEWHDLTRDQKLRANRLYGVAVDAIFGGPFEHQPNCPKSDKPTVSCDCGVAKNRLSRAITDELAKENSSG